MRNAPILIVVALICNCVGSAQAAVMSSTIDYGRDIRPILSENCFYCHGQDANKRKAKIRLDTLDGQRKDGLVIPGRPDDSEIIKRLLTTDKDDVMPPADSNRHVTQAQIQLLRRWISEGAPFDGHWAFTAPERPALPQVKNDSWIRNPIDNFVAAKLDAAGLFPSPEANKETLIRRLPLELIGLPPTLAEIDAFIADTSDKAYDNLINRLMSSPHYGERMALPWLDAARYADSNGFQKDGDTFQWVWRDWLVKALNDNMPFDQFTIEQLAGDLLPDSTREQKLATAFHRNGLLNGEGGNIAEEQRFVILFDRVDTTATNWLGLTMACAQCHDHKYDPITQKDYYSMLAAFNNVPETGTAGRITTIIHSAEPLLDMASSEQKELKNTLEANAAAARKQMKEERGKWEKRVKEGAETIKDEEVLKLIKRTDKKLEKFEERKVDTYFNDHVAPKLPGNPKKVLNDSQKAASDLKNNYPMVMVMSDSKPRTTHILDRGNYESPREKVEVNVPEFLPPLPPEAPRNRLGLAKWLVSKEQPLTARVIVNRMWQQFFGVGLVKTSEDFGVQSEPPIHRALLDWLAVEFRESGWDFKHMQRLILTSATYRQVSSVTPSLLEKDPENRLFARAPRFRLPSMIIRDQALAVSGLLVHDIGGKPVYPYQPKDIWDSLAITKERDFTYPQSTGKDLYRRSLYTFWRRTVAPSNMFDASQRQTCTVRSTATSTPLHALTTMNDPTFVEAARVLAEKIMNEPEQDRLAIVFRTIVSRWPDDKERVILQKSFEKQRARFAADEKSAQAFIAVGETKVNSPHDPIQLAALGAVCLGILNLDETVSRQ